MVNDWMKKCKVTITTVVEGQENSITRDGEMDLSAEKTQLFYREENAAVHISLYGETAEVERQGDYTLRLHLVRGEITQGELGIGGSSGEIQTLTRAVQYSIREKSLLISLKYDLIISGEKQNMQLRILARYND